MCWDGKVAELKKSVRVKLTFNTACSLLAASKLWMLRDSATPGPAFLANSIKAASRCSSQGGERPPEKEV